MPPRAAAPAAAGQNPRAQDLEQDSWFKKAIKYLAIWWIVSTASSFLLGPQSPVAGWLGKNAPGPSSGGDPSKEVKVPQQQQQTQAKGPEAGSMWPEGANLTLTVYLSTAQRWDHPEGSVIAQHTFQPVQYGDWDWTQSWETEFDVPQVGTSATRIWIRLDS